MGLSVAIIVVGCLLVAATHAVQLWSAPAAIPTTVPAACRAVLVQNITCDYGNNSLVTAGQAANGVALISSEATKYCTTSCYQSLRTFKTNVDSKCGNTEYNLYPNSNLTQSAAALADGLSWAYNLTCIEDATIHANCDNLPSMEGRSICLSPPGGGTFAYNSSVTQPTQPTLTSSLITQWVSAIGTIPTVNFTTSWYSSEFNSTGTASITSTASWNETLASELVQQTQYCWLTDDDVDNPDEEDYSEGCQNLMDEYCFPTPGAAVPPSPSRIPAICSPNTSTYITGTLPSTTNPPGATPTPYQPNMIVGCQQFYQVVGGDTCQQVADKFSIDLSLVSDTTCFWFLPIYVCSKFFMTSPPPPSPHTFDQMSIDNENH
ncbi:hypothetical protein F4824DRAFT_498074 [Ustulina deusta]|nr:hypothetical protein F4824DRAFT_498074 [Ustulina deusta]